MSRPFPLLITLFTRPNCGLCSTAKEVLSRVHSRRPFLYREIDILEPAHSKWKIYEFDTPVIHIDALPSPDHAAETTTSAKKLMHRVKEKDLDDVMDQVERTGPTIK